VPWLDRETDDALTELAATGLELMQLDRLNDNADRTPLIERLREGAEPAGRVVLTRVGALLAARLGRLVRRLRRSLHQHRAPGEACDGCGKGR
jgi:hypothetical protein